MTDTSPEHGAEELALPGLEHLTPPTVEERLAWADGPAQVIAAVRAHVHEVNRARHEGRTTPTTVPPISDTRRRTMEREALIEAGWHPLTGLPLTGVDGQRCGNCSHVRRRIGGYHKCDTVRETRGPGTDVRLSWPACTRYEPGVSHG